MSARECLIKLEEQVSSLDCSNVPGDNPLLLPPTFIRNGPHNYLYLQTLGENNEILHISFDVGQKKESSSKRQVMTQRKQAE